MKWLAPARARAAAPRRPTKRTLLKAALFIVAGAIINVAVAWGLATWIPPLLEFSHDGIRCPDWVPSKGQVTIIARSR